MELTNQEKKDILDCMLRKVSHISDREYQRRVWIRGEGPECDDFIETVCIFFHMMEIILERPEEFDCHGVSLGLLEDFSKKFEKFSDENDLPQFFIDTSEWTTITEMAKGVLHAFNWENSLIKTESADLYRNPILDHVLDDIIKFSLKKYDENMWIMADAEYKPDDFDEAVRHYFSTAESIIENYKDYGITEAQLPILKKFDGAFRKFWNGYEFPKLFLNTTEWIEITKMAKDVLKAFNHKNLFLEKK